jgi:hypothetical protein
MINFDIDQAVNDINTGAFEGEQPQQDGGQPSQGAPQINQQSFDPNLNIPYKANGREITEPLSTVIQRASMGYNYAQLMQQYKQQQSALEAQKQQIEQQAEKWRQYDDYANQNPEWANHVRSQWESRFASSQNQQSNGFEQFGNQSQQQQSQLSPEITRELAEMRSFVNQYKEEQHHRMVAEQDAALAQEIQTVQSEHPTIDLSATDPSNGESLESQILRHAQANGISSFRAAFRDMMFDRILAEKQTVAKETVARQMQQQVKQGFLGQSNSPMTQSQPQVNLSRHSYHSLVDMAIKDLGIT